MSSPGLSGEGLPVSLDVSAVPGQPVGAGRYIIELARALGARSDVELILWSRRGDARRWQELTPAQVRPDSPDSRVGRLLWEQRRLPRLLDHSAARVHHAPHYTMPARTGVPVVVTIHDLTFFDHPEWHQRSKVPVFRHAIRRAAARARALVCVSERTATLLAERVEVSGRVFVIPHGVDHDRFRASAPEPTSDDSALARLGARRPYLLFLGTLEPRKAVPDLVRAFAAIASDHRDLNLVLAGRPGWGAQAVHRAVAESGMAGRVRLTGYVADDEVPALLRQAEAVAYPAHEEGFGLPALEALACGAALVTTTGTAMAELAREAALLVPPGDIVALATALDEALSQGPAARSRRERGLAIAAGYTWERSATAHVAAYRWAADGALEEGGRRLSQ